LRDVAGMLRSFSYARWTAAKQASSMDHTRDGRLEALLAQWERETRREFLLAYEQAVAGSGLYGSFPAARGLLELFELEKALYELRYEVNNRPGWVRIPLQGILALAGGGLAGQ
jgi:maltose alpha-D-glucosyltransferase/alpha-amylase